ncbi:MAG: hypothetical protein IJF11_05510 [Clostridia bacterium]|nr:hypothetical protein [Clostridia bacterium]
MNFRQTVRQETNRKYVQMFDGSTPSPYEGELELDATRAYSSKRDRYYNRLSQERSEFNNALNKVVDTENLRLMAENNALEGKARAKFKKRQAIRTIIFILPVLVALLVGLDVFNESHGLMDKIQYDIGMELGFVIFLYVVFCILCLAVSAIFLNVKMYRNERYINRTNTVGVKKYNIIAIVVLAITLIIVMINVSNLIANLGKGKLVLVGADRREIIYTEKGSTYTLPTLKKSDDIKEDHFIRYTFDYWEIDGEKYRAGEKIELDGWYTARAIFRDKKWATLSFSASNASYIVSYNGTNVTPKSGEKLEVQCGTKITVNVEHYYSDKSFSVNGTSSSYPYTFTLEKNMSFSARSSDPGCIAPGTEIVLYDGTTKLVEELEVGDVLLVFNHESGKYEPQALLANIHANTPADYFDVIALTFSNGKELKIIDEHGLFDKDLNRYVYLNVENASDFIGHRFACIEHQGDKIVSAETTLEGVSITRELTKIYNPASIWHINLVANDILTLSAGMANLFEYDSSMKYDEEKMLADIERYGLFTYDDFKEYVPYEVYQIFPFKYYKVAIARGEFTYTRLLGLIKLYYDPNSVK